MARVYIVEDERTLQDLYTMYLSKMGHEIIGQSYNGTEALVDLYINHKTNPPDLIILDYMLPGQNGLELLRDLQHINYTLKTKILFITGTSHLQFLASKMGVSKFIQKPFNFEVLNKSIKELGFEKTSSSI